MNSTLFHHRIHVFSGHYGCGKTTVALNFALACAREGKKVVIVDMDIVNPYFRTVDARRLLEEAGIEVIASPFAGSNSDMPVLPPEISKVFENPELTAIFDVGGDGDGACALGTYARQFQEAGYGMYFVANTRRPQLQDEAALIEMAEEIEAASRMKFTGVVSNTNLGPQTQGQTLLSGLEAVQALCEKKGIPLCMICGKPQLLEQLPEVLKEKAFAMEQFLKLPWERGEV